MKNKLLDVIDETIKIIKNGNYTSPNGTLVVIGSARDKLKLDSNKAISTNWVEKKEDLEIIVKNQDSLDAAEELIMEGFRPEDITVLNMASWRVPGGGVLKGSRAQEEDICRRSNLLESIGVGSTVVSKYLGLTYDPYMYPLKEDEQILTIGVTVFRNSNYELRERPFRCNILTASAIQRPTLVRGHLSENDKELMKRKIRLILNNSSITKVKVLVLGAFGCGAYGNPPEDVAKLFKEILTEETIPKCIERVVFAILDKKSTDNNLKAFQDVFNNRD